jgi:Rrf2 family transcriptional regulator, cysteine metabolism repressor
MKLTTKSEYSILALLYMARHDSEGFIKIDNICSHCGIPRKYLELLLNVLRQNRYIKTRRGTAGGYSLSRQPKEITIAEIVRLMDGALAPTESVSQYFYSDTPLSKEPGLLKIFKEIRDFIANRLEKLTLADLA